MRKKFHPIYANLVEMPLFWSFIIYFQASDRVQLNLTAVKSSVSKKNFRDLEAIAKELCAVGNIIAERPLGI